MKEWILVTGGAGYIGTNVVNLLARAGENVIVVDNFSNCVRSHIDTVCKLHKGKVVVNAVDLLDDYEMKKIFEKFNIKTVVHLAGKKYVSESETKRDAYYKNNILATDKLLSLISNYGVGNLVFSSSITVYGNAKTVPVDESAPFQPISYYAETKVEGEKMIKSWTSHTNGAGAGILRLANPVGAGPFMLGDENLSGMKAVVPYLVDCVLDGKSITINGNTHATKDGTAIRDYVHVEDIAASFVAACVLDKNGMEVFNIGRGGEGYSVLDLVKTIEDVVGTPLAVEFGPRREGDVSVFVANNKKMIKGLQVTPTKDLTEMVKSQYEFSKNLRQEK